MNFLKDLSNTSLLAKKKKKKKNWWHSTLNRLYFMKLHWLRYQMNIHMCRYVASELATDIVVNVGEVKFYLHKVCWSVDLHRNVCTFYHVMTKL